jgi:hypothetical protein
MVGVTSSLAIKASIVTFSLHIYPDSGGSLFLGSIEVFLKKYTRDFNSLVLEGLEEFKLPEDGGNPL